MVDSENREPWDLFARVVHYFWAPLYVPDLHVSLLANYESVNDIRFRRFRRQLFHWSLEEMLYSLKPGMTTPEVVRFPDGHFRRVIYGLSPYIADYPEQVLLACIMQGWCPKYVLFMRSYFWLTSHQMYSSLQQPQLCLVCAPLSGTYQTNTSIV